MTEGITITRVGADRIDELIDFWLLLHAFQGAASAPVPGVPLREDSDTGPLVRAMYLKWLSQPDSFAFFAEDDRRPVGFVIGFIEEPSEIWDTGRIGHVDSLLVLPEMRGHGVGRLLMDAVYDHLSRVGVRTVGLDVVANNSGALRFYEHEGFTPTFLQMYRALDPDG